MARTKKKAPPKTRNPHAWAAAVSFGNAAGRHRNGALKPRPKGNRSQQLDRAIRESY